MRGTAIFDLDSTVIAVESLDEIIRIAIQESGLSPEETADLASRIEHITDAGMNGEITLGESITRRLSIARVHQRHVDAFNQRLSTGTLFTEGMEEVFRALRQSEHAVFIVSGALRPCLTSVATLLHLSTDACFGNDYRCDDDGWITGIDLSQPLASSSGKSSVIRMLKESGRAPGPIVMVGDGTSDLRPWLDNVVDHFIGCGIRKIRPSVRDAAPEFVTDAKRLQSALFSSITRA